jgi:hypothetical protein
LHHLKNHHMVLLMHIIIKARAIVIATVNTVDKCKVDKKKLIRKTLNLLQRLILSEKKILKHK